MLIECYFLIPTVRDSDRSAHEAARWHSLHTKLLELAGGFTGPESCRGRWKDDHLSLRRYARGSMTVSSETATTYRFERSSITRAKRLRARG
ncbi:MAG: hypothetical protein HYV07_07590 [Deltaproteobacteria bacterium]|nr:hypothetical protein [Deltaproteobacteria bacterium]